MDCEIDSEFAVRLRCKSILLHEGSDFDDGRMDNIVRPLNYDFVIVAKELDAGMQLPYTTQYDRIFNGDFPCAVLSDVLDGCLGDGENPAVGQMGDGVHHVIPSIEREWTKGEVLAKSSNAQHDWCLRC